MRGKGMGQKGHVINKYVCVRERKEGDGGDKTEGKNYCSRFLDMIIS